MSEFAAGPPEVEERDDSETYELHEPQSRTGAIEANIESTERQSLNFYDNTNEETKDGAHNMDNEINAMDISRMDEDDDKLDMVSVLSGTVEGDNDGGDQLQGDEFATGIFGKNLSKVFDNAEEMDRHLKSSSSPGAASLNSKSSSGNVNQLINKFQNRSNATEKSDSRPPLAPMRAGTSVPPVKSNHYTVSSGQAADDKRLSVFLRVRPPVGAAGKQGDEGAINTIEVMSIKSSTSLPSTIRTYPPLHSNAAKVVRVGSRHATSDSSLKKALSSKSLVAANDDGSSDSGTDYAEVRGVKEYSYSGVFGPNATQCEVYDNVAAPLVEGLFPQKNSGDALGESALLFTLGVTNAGKTHTVMGTGFEKRKGVDKKKAQTNDITPEHEWGIIPRSLHHILSRVKNSNEADPTAPQLQMYMSYLEIYNEQIYDLLPDKSNEVAPRRFCDGPAALKLRESRRGRIFVRGLARRPVNNVRQGLELAQEAKNNRHTASNNINANSSRSHSICQFEIAHVQHCGTTQPDADVDSECATDDESVCSRSSNGSMKNSKHKSTIIWIVDLAGSERSKKTGVMSHTRHQKEAALINASLMNLMRCLREMLNHQPKKRGVASKGGVVPFRESKLTHMFMNHLTGPAASRTCMIVNVNPAADDYDETQHVLSYAATARNVKISAVDYNRKRRFLAKESNAPVGSLPEKKLKTSPVKKLAKIVKKISPKRKASDLLLKKRKMVEPKQEVKRPRSNYNTIQSYGGKKTSSKSSQAALAVSGQPACAELEELREDNFSLKITIDDLHQKLVEIEAEVRSEVVDMMNEQLQDNKEWYEKRIANLTKQIYSLQSSNTQQAHQDSQKYIDDLLERINECEEEMSRMREDHDAEKEEMALLQLKTANEFESEIENIVQDHLEELQSEQEKSQRLTEEVGTLRHQSEELRVSHCAILAKYNELLTAQHHAPIIDNGSNNTSDSGKENSSLSAGSSNLKSPTLKKLPRERCSGVASTATCVDIITSPKKKRGGWFIKSPAKVATGDINTSPMNPNGRSPLRNINNNA